MAQTHDDRAEPSPVLCEVEGGVAQLTLNRPERLNAWTPRMGRELARAFRALDEDDAVRAVVVTGAGRAFCAGADLAAGAETFRGEDSGIPDPERAQAGRAGSPLAPWEMRKPVIAAIQGPAVGVGLTLTLQWDLRIAAADAKLAFAFVRRGVVTELASTWILPRLVGIARAADLLLTGRTLLGEEAARLGLVNQAVEREAVLPRAREIAHTIAEQCAPASVAATKRLLWRHLGCDDPHEAAAREGRVLARLGALPDAAEGVMSFVEKRKPAWKLSPRDAPDVD